MICVKCYDRYDGNPDEQPLYCQQCRQLFSEITVLAGVDLCCINDSSGGHYAPCDRKKIAQPLLKPVNPPRPDDALQRQLDLQKQKQHDQRLWEYRRLDPNRPH